MTWCAILGVVMRRGSNNNNNMRFVSAFSTAAFTKPVSAARSSSFSSMTGRTAAAAILTGGQQSVILSSAANSNNNINNAQQHLFARAFRPRSSKSAASSSSSTSLRASVLVEEDTVSDLKKKLKESMQVTHPAYEVINTDVVTEYGSYCTLYRHKQSGAELLSVSTDDDNKVFGITFRTPPEDGTGIAHILEHSVLCGSRKYTTKDPFVHLLKGSLQTFLNAFTYPDRTCYVVASQNEKDFYNLINVYADAVFHPRAITDQMVLAQEGHHLELQNKADDLTYKGVVYNEMKGVYSSPDSLLMRTAQRSIFPDNVYAVDSGGDPRVIPDLTFEQFVDFHQRFYHPANSRIFFSGDDQVYKRLELMDEYLSDFTVRPVEDSKIKWQPKRYTEPLRKLDYYPVGPGQPATHSIMVNWLLNDKPFTPLEEITLAVLDHLLMGTTSAILRKSLMESGLGDAITGGGISDELLQATFMVGLKGVQEPNVGAVEDLIMETLEKVAEEGFAADDIASSLNTIEFSLREFNTGSFPKGLSFMLASMSKWLYEESPTDALKFEEPLKELKDSIEQSGSKIFQDMINSLLVQNQHRTVVQLAPSTTLEQEEAADEQNRLARIKEQLSEADLEDIIDQTDKLLQQQAAEDSPEDRATIPSLELADLKRESIEYPIDVTENENQSGVTVVRHELGSTAGIVYANLAVDLSGLSVEDQVPLLPLFARMLMETGAGDYDSVQLSRRIGTYTGGVNVNLLTTAAYADGVDQSLSADGDNLQTKLIVQGKSTADNVDELFSLFKLVLTEARFDSSQDKVIELLRESRSRLESSVQGAGHAVSNTRMKARYRVGGYIDEINKGVTYLGTVKELLEQAENDWPALLARLEQMRDVLLDESICRSGMALDLTGDERVLKTIQPAVKRFLQDLPGDAAGNKLPNYYQEPHPWVEPAKKLMKEQVPIKDEGFVVPTQVSYVGKSGMLYEAGERIPGSAQVVARFLRTGYLWDTVRVMGGAYGGFCTFSEYSGYFSFLSYRDPNLAQTLTAYDEAADALLAAADAMEEDPDILATAIIGTVGDLDGALSADQKGFTQYQRWLINESAEHRQQVRDEILATTPQDFRDFAHRLRNIQQVSTAVVSSKGAFETAEAAGCKMDELIQIMT